MTRLRPIASATAPVKGAISATARVVALTVRLTAAGVAANSRASSGSSACGRIEFDEGADGGERHAQRPPVRGIALESNRPAPALFTAAAVA